MTARRFFEIGNARIAPGQRQTVDLPVSVLPDHTPVSLRVHVIHGRRDGPVSFVSAAVHGDEVIGVEITRRLLSQKSLSGLRGTLLVVPIVNTFGFLNRSRYLPDRRDLNRSFPGNDGGSLASRLAHLFLNEVVLRCQFGIDLHSAAVNRTNLPQLRVTPEDVGLMELARVFGAPVIIPSAERSGSLRAESRDRGVSTILYEAGEGLRVDETAVRIGVAGILRVLHHQGMMSGRGPAQPRVGSMLARRSQWVRTPGGGLLTTYRRDGEMVEKGDLLARVANPFGGAEEEVRAPLRGLIVGQAVMPVVNEGDAIFHLAEIESPVPEGVALEEIARHLSRDPLFDEDEII
ncbi:succinylglutamate desuccinylase/aspartoacylase family protein [Pseudooceanicola sp. C21-150M6]|uniref:succinylglutamate desuccinylase/aspartoacylase family protein n=1 Tax=Pseudooceanicola sp. C21-150M6 TaxID=3434355 RepID=UPI003D7F5EB4